MLLEYHTIAEDGVTSGKHRFYSGQILYSKIRSLLMLLTSLQSGMSAYIDLTIPMALQRIVRN